MQQYHHIVNHTVSRTVVVIDVTLRIVAEEMAIERNTPAVSLRTAKNC